MAHTEAHIPYKVMKEKLGTVEHDHRNGPCDYDPEFDAAEAQKKRWTHYRHCNKRRKIQVKCYHTYRDLQNGTQWQTLSGLNLEGFAAPVSIGKKVHRQEMFNLDGTPYTGNFDFSEEAKTAHDVVKKGWGLFVEEKDRNAYSSLYKKFNGDTVTDFLLYHTFEISKTFSEAACTCDDWPPAPRCTKEAYGRKFDRYWSHNRDPYENRGADRGAARDQISGYLKEYKDGVPEDEDEEGELDYWSELSREDDNYLD